MGQVGSSELNSAYFEAEIESGVGEKVYGHIVALLVPKKQVKLLSQQLKFLHSFVGRDIRAGLQGLMISEKDEALSS